MTPVPAADDHPALNTTSFATRAGHELIWAAVAVLFCVVEIAVLATELNPARLFRRAQGASLSPAAVSRSAGVRTL
ncbi:MAG TPA: hypothetical protein VHE61_12050 [Opitutaceae bacterium]|nr:hypothetical protein [Opitutaceae bacterium]